MNSLVAAGRPARTTPGRGRPGGLRRPGLRQHPHPRPRALLLRRPADGGGRAAVRQRPQPGRPARPPRAGDRGGGCPHRRDGRHPGHAAADAADLGGLRVGALRPGPRPVQLPAGRGRLRYRAAHLRRVRDLCRRWASREDHAHAVRDPGVLGGAEAALVAGRRLRGARDAHLAAVVHRRAVRGRGRDCRAGAPGDAARRHPVRRGWADTHRPDQRRLRAGRGVAGVPGRVRPDQLALHNARTVPRLPRARRPTRSGVRRRPRGDPCRAGRDHGLRGDARPGCLPESRGPRPGRGGNRRRHPRRGVVEPLRVQRLGRSDGAAPLRRPGCRRRRRGGAGTGARPGRDADPGRLERRLPSRRAGRLLRRTASTSWTSSGRRWPTCSPPYRPTPPSCP